MSARSVRLTALVSGGAAAAMLCVAFAAKPLYDTFCRVTGFGGTVSRVEAVTGDVLERRIEVRFDANTNGGLPFDFGPAQRPMTVQVGARDLAFYELTNTSDEPVRAIASYNVTPHKVGPYFRKIECFCFEEQTYAPGETVDLPVAFFIDPSIAEERQLDDVRTVTLSYTFFEAKSGETAPAPAFMTEMAAE